MMTTLDGHDNTTGRLGHPCARDERRMPVKKRCMLAIATVAASLLFGVVASAQKNTAEALFRDVPVRLEKRLAALLDDLAKHKRMSLSSCLEEILLHTNEGVGPHTKSQLRYIQELKKKHGIDYDSHASYRFIED